MITALIFSILVGLDFPIKNYEDMRARLCADADVAALITCMKIFTITGKLKPGQYKFIFDNKSNPGHEPSVGIKWGKDSFDFDF